MGVGSYAKALSQAEGSNNTSFFCIKNGSKSWYISLRDSVNEFSPLLQSMQASAKEEILCYNFLPRYGRSCLDKTNHNNYHLVNMFDKYYSIRIVVR
jgi:hypothetical protein